MMLKVNGEDTFAYTGGQPFDAAQPTIVFVHGAGLDHSVFAMQARYFAHHGSSVLCPDLPGHGRSAGAPAPTIEAMGAWVVDLIDAAGVSEAGIAGHSMGSLVALEAAAQAGPRATALALLGTAFPMRVGKPLLDAAEANDHAALDMMTSFGHSMRAQLGGNISPGGWIVGGSLRLLERAADGVVANDLGACHRYENGTVAAAAVQCPTHLVLGDADRMTPPKTVTAIRDGLREVTVHTMAATGHIMMSEQPNQTLDLLIAAMGER